MSRLEIDFEHELSRGLAAYNDTLAAWWCKRAADASHARAYLNIAEYIYWSVGRAPRLIVDYACGGGHLLARLGLCFPDSRLVGLDGSARLLDLARRRMKRLGQGWQKRVLLIETPLPAMKLPEVKADLAIHVFPNMVWPAKNRSGLLIGRLEAAIARSLAGQRESSDEEESKEINSFLTTGRRISHDLRRLLRRGGLCVRAEYAGARRDELSLLEFTRISFEEGSLDTPVAGRMPRQWFRVLASRFFRSRVIEDVYQQSGKARGGGGGYLVTVLRAL